MARIERAVVAELRKRLQASPNLLQVVVGPRQVGKTTALEQVIEGWSGGAHYATADLPAPPDAAWIQAQWAVARREAQKRRGSALLVLDEIQKVPRWSEVVKAELDDDRRHRRPLRVVVLGSAALSVARGAPRAWLGASRPTSCRTGARPSVSARFAGTWTDGSTSAAIRAQHR